MEGRKRLHSRDRWIESDTVVDFRVSTTKPRVWIACSQKACAAPRPEDCMPMDAVPPAGSTEKSTNIAKQPSKSHYRPVTINASTFLQQESCLPRAKDLLDHRQTRYAVRALTADGHHPMHQLLPANFRLGELYRHEGATGQPSSTGWTRLEKTHRLLGSRLAQ
jgi:hypothetical protein